MKHQLKCGCIVETTSDPKTCSLTMCPIHKAAPDMYEALVKYGSALMFLEGNFKERFSKTELESLQQAYRKGTEALAKAEGKENDGN